MRFTVTSSVLLLACLTEASASSPPPSQFFRLPEHSCPNRRSVLQYPLGGERGPQCDIRASSPPTHQPNNTITEPVSKERPWDHPIRCLETSAYCIHASNNFASNRGLTIITKPHIASTLKSTIEKFSAAETYPPKGHTLYSDAELPGRGKGLIANQTFERGDLILVSTPVLIVSEETFDLFGDEVRFPFQTEAVDSLPLESRELFYALAGHFGGDRVEDIIRTNAFGTRIGGEKHGIIVPEAARLNHECRPNARFAFDINTLTHKVHATRTIQAGEELTFSYIDEKQPYRTRQEHLHSHWGFKCICKHCSLDTEERLESDERIEKINELRAELKPLTSKATPEMAVRLIELYEEEELNALAEAYMLAALRFCAWMDEEETKRYAGLAVENWLVWEKEGVRNKEVLRSLERDARGAWCWGKRWESNS